MSTNEERREAAKQKLADRLERDRQQARKRKIAIGSVSSIVVIAIVATAAYFVVDKIRTDNYNNAHTNCTYTDTPSQLDSIPDQVPDTVKDPAQRAAAQKSIDEAKAAKPKQRKSPKPATSQLKDGTTKLTLDTSQGAIPIQIDRKPAPCNAAAVLSLADHGYYNDTSCHRMTTSALKVIQCGDPTETGGGMPGWTSPDEAPTDLKPAGQPNPMTGQQTVTYPRGTIAIANSGQPQQGQPNSGGAAQFFIMVQDGQLPSSYAVVGKVADNGMTVVDKVAAGGIVEGSQPNPQTGQIEPTPGDGKPKLPLTIQKAIVA